MTSMKTNRRGNPSTDANPKLGSSPKAASLSDISTATEPDRLDTFASPEPVLTTIGCVREFIQLCKQTETAFNEAAGEPTTLIDKTLEPAWNVPQSGMPKHHNWTASVCLTLDACHGEEEEKRDRWNVHSVPALTKVFAPDLKGLFVQMQKGILEEPIEEESESEQEI